MAITIAAQLVTSFIAAAAFGIIFNAPKESLIKCGLVGMIGWIVYFMLAFYGVDEVVATVSAAFIIAVISQVYAKLYKTPVIIFTVAGIIPLVPGGIAYNAMRNFVTNDYNMAINLAAKAFMISGAIAMGIILSEVINQLIRQSKLNSKA
ncbi:threonine/serine exporter family protein [Jeotgalibacillus soli]|uniref:Membrane protein n=1 Tax=Jeotgalibacillus soli TaxID=889306 RepID=A0A0C2W024_9BACL|nr:threonine/serine exporter family protein [Jeotgalibacillus soli]KIL49508.1 membrane protein [Jeotgalibacillus soli]